MSASAWEVKSKVRPAARSRASNCFDACARFRVEAAHRLVQDVELALREEASRETQLLGHALRVGANRLAERGRLEIEGREHPGHVDLVVAPSLQAQHERQEVAPGQVVRRHEPFWQERELLARARVGVPEPEELDPPGIDRAEVEQAL